MNFTDANPRKSAKDILISIASRQMKELVEHYRLGFSEFQPNAESMENIERHANELWQAMDDATFIKVERKLDYA